MTSQPATDARKDRRLSGRKPSQAKVRCRLKRATEEGRWMATVQNISAEGIGLIANRPFRTGMSLTMELPTSANQVSKSILVHVLHARPQTGNRAWVLGGTLARKLTKEELEFLRSRAPSLVPASERRTNVRHATRFKGPCPVIRAAEEGPWYATIRNVSDKGIGLIANRAFKPGVLLTVELPNKKGELGKPRLLRLLHARAQPSNQWVLGGAFLSKLTPEEVEALA